MFSNDPRPPGDDARPPDPAADQRPDPYGSPPGAPAAYGVRVGPVAGEARSRRRVPVLTIAIALVAVLAGGALFMSGYTLGERRDQQPGTPAEDDAAFQPFWDAYGQITDRYAGGEVDRDALIEGAIKGMFEALGDPYSSYLSPEDFQATLQGISGEFEGIGAEIGTVDGSGQTSDCNELSDDCRLVIIAPLDGSPAQKAGVRAGDVVSEVDGSSLNGLSIDEARDRIRGRKGTEVTLTLVREGEAQPIVVKIVRDVIVTREVVERDLAGGDVGYVRLSGFSEGGAKDFKEAVAEDVEAGRTKLIIDVRGNPGGYITAARDVASQFIAEGPIFWQENAKGEREATEATGDGVATNPEIEIVLLIDRGSASASEILAGALADTDRATLVGETTFGKGTVQEWTQLDGAGGFRLTVAKWLTPNETWIHEKGIEPDVEVTLPPDLEPREDPALDKALEILGETALGTLDRAA
jgi:carboxyl-terminal processing protease